MGPCGLEIAPRQSPYEALAESIVYQQLTGKAAATIYARLCKSFGSRRCPSPEKIADATLEQLRAAGLSRNKAAALRDLAYKVLDGDIPTRRAAETLTDDELVARLTAVKGIGRWTVEMFLIFTLGRPDVLPRPKELATQGERWRPYRTAASWYLWRATELEAS